MRYFIALAACIAVVVPSAAVASADDQAREVVAEMVAAHGGMERWNSADAVYFEDQWTYQNGEQGPVAHVTVEQGQRRAYMDFPDLNASIVWDGERAWSVNWALPMPPRFIATLNYYFLNLPWLVSDPGVNIAYEGTREVLDDPTRYIAVRVTYDPGVGDTPDDYYVLLIDPDTKKLAGCEYIVTYRALLPEGVEHTPPHILIFDEFATVGGLVVPTKFTVYEEGDFYAGCEVNNWSFDRTFDEARMVMPEGAVVDESQP